MKLSVLSVVALFVATAMGASTGYRSCYIHRFGKLKMFSGEAGNVEVPCKYRLVDMECGGFHVRVTAGSSVDDEQENRFTPDTVWVKIIRLEDGALWKGRTASKLLRQSDIDNTTVWVEKGGDLALDVEGYFPGDGMVILSQTDVFDIFFSRGGNREGVDVMCHASDVMSMPYPDSLCGSMERVRVLGDRRENLFGEDVPDDADSRSQAVTHDVMNNNKVKQSMRCKDVAKRVQSCAESPLAVRTCSNIFGIRSLARCLLDDKNDVDDFDACVMSVCDRNSDPSGANDACLNLKETVQARCPEELSNLPDLGC